jgi:hypothetical protein
MFGTYIIKTILLPFSIGCILTIAIVAWLVYEDDTQEFMLNSSQKSSDLGISKIEFAKTKSTIIVTIHLFQDAACDTIMHALDINSMDIRTYTYTPRCQKINPTLMKITYEKEFLI